jgi:hypothetical protein
MFQSKQEIILRLEQIEEELEEARSNYDDLDEERISVLEEEMEELERELYDLDNSYGDYDDED